MFISEILFKYNFSSFYSEIFLFLSISILLLFGVFYSTSLKNNLPIINLSLSRLTLVTLVISSLLIYFNPVKNLHISLFNGLLVNNHTINIFKLSILLGSIICILIFVEYLKKNKINFFEYWIIFLISILSMILLVSSNDFFSIFLAIEIQSFTLYLFASFGKNSAFCTESSLKYFVLGGLSSGLLLFGISLIFGFLGTLSFDKLSLLTTGLYNSSDSNLIILLALIFISSGLLFKLGAAPFHAWTPDVYEGAPLPSTTLFATLPKIAIFSILLKIYLFVFYDFINFWEPFILFSSFSSMLIGAFGAFQQKKIKRLLAYSSIGHVGYLLLGLGGNSYESVQGALLYLFIYIIMTFNIWTLTLSLFNQKKKENIKYLTDLNGLFKSNPFLTFSFALIVFSMAGIPPLAGFFAKFYIFFSAIENSLFSLVFIGVITSCISAFYYIKLLKILFFENKNIIQNWSFFSLIDREKSLIIALSSLFLILFFSYPQPFLNCTYDLVFSWMFSEDALRSLTPRL